jgi:hypothetical protein
LLQYGFNSDDVEISVNKVADALTRSAAVAWLLVGLLTLASSAVLPATILINAIGATVFLAVALLLAWKASVLRHLPANRALDPLFRVEAKTVRSCCSSARRWRPRPRIVCSSNIGLSLAEGNAVSRSGLTGSPGSRPV